MISIVRLTFIYLSVIILLKFIKELENMTDLKKMRKEKNITQVELADLLGVTQKTISSYETKRINPSAEIFYKLSKIFEIPLEKLVEQHYNPNTPPRSDKTTTNNTDTIKSTSF
jgi:putative transcriptional regulator